MLTQSSDGASNHTALQRDRVDLYAQNSLAERTEIFHGSSLLTKWSANVAFRKVDVAQHFLALRAFSYIAYPPLCRVYGLD